MDSALAAEVPYAIVFAIAAFVIPLGLFTDTPFPKRLVLAGVNATVNFVVGFLAGWVFFGAATPDVSTMWSEANVFPLIGGSLLLAVTTWLLSYANGIGDYEGGVGVYFARGIPIILLICVFAWWVGSMMAFVEPNHWLLNGQAPWCDPSGTAKMLQLFQPKEGTPGTLPDADPNHLIRVTQEVAIAKARQAFPGDIGSYLQPGIAYLQKLDGRWVYIVDLKPSDQQSFNNAGGNSPGYVIVSAEDPNAQAVYRGGFKIHYVPDLGWPMDNDLDRYVYYHFTLPFARGLVVDDLHGMEVRDGDDRPFYTGSLEQPVVGYEGKKIVGMIAVDAQTGEITWWKSVSQIPSWVDRIYPEDYIQDLASNWWAKYANHYVCIPWGQTGQVSIDSSSYQLTGHGDAQYVFTYTSPNSSDTTMVGELVVNPTSGAAINIPLKGATESAAQQIIQKYLDSVSQRAQLDPEFCQLQQIYSRYVWYCVVNQGDTYRGVSLLDTAYTTDPSKVLYAQDLTTLVGLYQQQLSGTLPPGTIPNAGGTISLTGTVTHLSNVLVNQGGTEYRIFQLHGTGIPDNVVFWVAMPNSVAALMQSGDTVTVVVQAPGQKLPTDTHAVVSSLVDKSLPAGTTQG